MEQWPDAINMLSDVTLLEADFRNFASEQKILKRMFYFHQYSAVYIIKNLYKLYLDFLPDSPSNDESPNIEINDVNSFWIIVQTATNSIFLSSVILRFAIAFYSVSPNT